MGVLTQRNLRERLKALIGSHDANRALALVDEARGVLSHSEAAPLVELVEEAWGRPMSLMNVDLDTLSRERSAALASRAVARQALSTREISTLTPKELVAGFRSGSPQPSHVVCRKALTWDLNAWAACEFFNAAYDGGLRAFTHSEGFAPDPYALQRALREVGFPTIADDLPWLYKSTSKDWQGLAGVDSPAGPRVRRTPSAEALVQQAIDEAVNFSGVSALGALLMHRYASLAPALAEWRKLGALPPAERWVFGASRPRQVPGKPVAVPLDPSPRAHAIIDGGAVPCSPLGLPPTNTDEAAAAAKAHPPAAVIWVRDSRMASAGWEAIRASTKPDLNTAAAALESLPLRLLAIHAAAQLRGAPVLAAIFRLGLVTETDWWATLAKKACTEGSLMDTTAGSVEALMSKRAIGPTLNAASRVGSVIATLADLVRQAACLRVPDARPAHFTMYGRGTEDPSLALSMAFAVAGVRSAQPSEAREPSEWRAAAAERIRIRPRSPRPSRDAVRPILLMLARPPLPGSVVYRCLTDLGATIFDTRTAGKEP